MKINLSSLSSSFLLCTVLVACGGGESSSSQPVDTTSTASTGGASNQKNDVPELLTKQFIAGMHYTTVSQNGITSNNGEFSVLADEIVTFYLGDYKLPSVLGSGTFTPLGYVPSAFSENAPSVINFTRLLQSLDVDLEPSNGIQIPESLRQSVGNGSAETLNITYPSTLFERLDLVLDLLEANNVTELINTEVAKSAFQSEVDKIDNEFIIAAAVDNTPVEGGCTDVRNGFISTFPCIPGTGGFAIGELKVESIVAREPLVSGSGGRRHDTIVGESGRLNDMHRFVATFGEPFKITEFSDSLNVAIVLFTSTKGNPFRDDVIQGSGWEHTELFLDDSYIGNLPFTSESNLQQVVDRCGLSSNFQTEGDTRRIILSPGTYSWNANAYESYGCRTGFHCPSVEQGSQQIVGGVIVTSGSSITKNDEALVEQGQNPIWEWSGSFDVQSGECIVINTQGSATSVDEVPNSQEDFSELYGRYYGSDWEDYTYEGNGGSQNKECEEHIINDIYNGHFENLKSEIDEGHLVLGRCPIVGFATYSCEITTEWGGNKSKSIKYYLRPGHTSYLIESSRELCEDKGGVFEVF